MLYRSELLPAEIVLKKLELLPLGLGRILPAPEQKVDPVLHFLLVNLPIKLNKVDGLVLKERDGVRTGGVAEVHCGFELRETIALLAEKFGRAGEGFDEAG